MKFKVIILIFIVAIIGYLFTNSNNEKLNERLNDYNDSKFIDKSLVRDISNTYISNKSIDNLKAVEYSLNIPSEGELGDCTMSGDIIYYSILYRNDMGNYANNIEIYSYNITSKLTKLLYGYKDVIPMYLNELRGNKENLFWVTFNSNMEWKLCKYRLLDGKLEVIRTNINSNSLIMPCIDVSNKYLTWYESCLVNNELINYLLIYDISKNMLKKTTNVVLNSAYERSFIRDGFTVYLTKNEKDNIINILNLDTLKIKKIITNINIETIVSNGKYTIWFESFEVPNVYVYEHKNNDYYIVNSLNEGQSVAAIDINNHYMFISDRDENNIYGYNLKNKYKMNLTKKFNNNKNLYVIPYMTIDNKYIAQNILNDGISKCLVIENN